MDCVFKAEFQEIAGNFHIFHVMEPETSKNICRLKPKGEIPWNISYAL